jgi:succinate dehydrogenase/fumarate reductase flavoprotein subunit
MATQILPKRSETALAVPSAGSLAAGELAMNVTDGKFYTKTSGGVVKEIGGAGAVTLQDVTTSGSVTNNDITLDGADIIFEGALANAFETTLTVAEPTADRTITLPNQSGTVAMDGDALAYAIVFGG